MNSCQGEIVFKGKKGKKGYGPKEIHDPRDFFRSWC